MLTHVMCLLAGLVQTTAFGCTAFLTGCCKAAFVSQFPTFPNIPEASMVPGGAA